VRFSVRNARSHNRERQSLLSRYSTDLGQCLSRKRSEQALRAATTEQMLANRAKSEFLATMSHELRTPLNAIIGFSELIEMLSIDPTAAKTREYARHVTQAGKHLHEIISDILDISKLESGSLELDLEYVPLWDLIEASTTLVGSRIKQKRQELVLALPTSLPSVFADARRIKQVLINLLGNAHKFTPTGKRIFVSAKIQLDQTVAISVRDEGIGMTTDEVLLALKPFGQVRSGRDHTHEGTGLGLPISKAMIEQHGGSFCVTSRKGAGTTVTFTLRMLAVPTPILSEENRL
jgi:two-component system cell cycle sensor histidine kinase PleC